MEQTADGGGEALTTRRRTETNWNTLNVTVNGNRDNG